MQIVFPDAQHPPARLAQRARHQPVAGLVARQLRTPERPVARRPPAMPRARVPEAAVHEDRELEPGKHEVRTHGELKVEG